MVKAIWNGVVIAESAETVRVEGNHYFPPEAIRRQFLVHSPTTTVCPWKGDAQYLTVTVDGSSNYDAAWYYDHPKDAAKQIKDHVAFRRGVKVVEA